MKKVTNKTRFFATTLGLSMMAVAAPEMSRAGILYSNGFEPGDPGAADFFDSTTGVQPAPDITVVPSGGGTLGLTAASGNYYAEITNVPDAYSTTQGLPPGYGQSVATDYGYVRNGGTLDPISGAPLGPGVANNGQAFYESTAYYINTNWSAPGSPGNANTGFWIDTTPFNDPNYADETNFRVTDGGNGTISVSLVGYGTAVSNAYPSVTITQSGWYTFKTTFENDGGNVANTLSVSDAGGNVIASAFNDPGAYANAPLGWSDLQGTNYGDWTTVWSDGFAGNTIGIDDVQVGTVPEPASLSLLGLGVPLLMRRRRKA